MKYFMKYFKAKKFTTHMAHDRRQWRELTRVDETSPRQ